MIIFLDIDGVLATTASYRDFPTYQLDPDAVAAFVDLYNKLDTTGVVISSDWRYIRSLGWFSEAFKHYGFDNINILGTTQQDEDPDGRALILDIGLSRGQKILKWMKDNNYSGDYVVLEDNLNIVQGSIPYNKIIWVANGFDRKGLTKTHVDDFLSSRS